MRKFLSLILGGLLVIVSLFDAAHVQIAYAQEVDVFIDSQYGYQFQLPDGFWLDRRWDTGAGHNLRFINEDAESFDLVILNLSLHEETLEAHVRADAANGVGTVLSLEPLALAGGEGLRLLSEYAGAYHLSILTHRSEKLYSFYFPLGERPEEPIFVAETLASFAWLLGDFSEPVPGIMPGEVTVDEPAGDDAGRGAPTLQFPFCGRWRISGGYNTQWHVGQYSEWALDWVNYDGDTIGAPIYAAHVGVVYAMTWDSSGGGWMVKLRYTSDTRYTTYYLHLNGFNPDVSVNDVVQAGDLIAYAGASGGVTGPHLHFSYLLNAYSIKPEPMSGQTGFEYNQVHFRDCSPPDTTPPTNPTSISPGCTAESGAWQNTCNNTDFTWSGAADSGSGVAGYQFYWGTNASGTGTSYTTSTRYNPTAVGEGVHYFRLRTKDQAGNYAPWQTMFILRYDATPPTGSLSINNGSAQTWQTLVTLSPTGSDTLSGAHLVRFRDQGGAWTDWQGIKAVTWVLPAVTGQTCVVEAQVQDAAGNLSGSLSDTIFLDIYPDRPASANFILQRSTFGMSAFQASSSGFSLNGTLSQTSTGGTTASENYRLASGFWSWIFTWTDFFLPMILR